MDDGCRLASINTAHRFLVKVSEMQDHSPTPPPFDREYYECLINEIEAAKFLGYSVRALQNWRVRGGGPKFVKVSARSIRYRRIDLKAWIEARLQSNTSTNSH